MWYILAATGGGLLGAGLGYLNKRSRSDGFCRNLTANPWSGAIFGILTGLLFVAVVFNAGLPLKTLVVSPFRNPL